MKSKTYRVVVGWDGTPEARAALNEACEFAAAHPEGQVHVGQVIPRGRGIWETQPEDVRAELAHSELETEVDVLVRHFNEENGGSFNGYSASVLRGEPAIALASFAASLRADLLVVGAHEHPQLERIFKNSVIDDLVRLAPCPVLVSRPNRSGDGQTLDPACPNCVEIRRESRGKSLWCNQHLEHHGPRHTYNYSDHTNSFATSRLVV